MKAWRNVLILVAIVATIAFPALAINYGWLLLRDEGVSQGPFQQLNCSGGGISCTRSGVQATISVTGGGSADGGWLLIDAGPAGAYVYSTATEWKTNAQGSQGQLSVSGGAGAPTYTATGNAGELLVGKGGTTTPGWVTQGDGGSILVAKGAADPVWVGPGLLYQSPVAQGPPIDPSANLPTWDWFFQRKLMECHMAGRSATSLTCFGGTGPGSAGSAAAALTGATMWYVNFTTATTLNATAGDCGTGTSNVDVMLKPLTLIKWRSHDTDITNQRLWLGHSDASMASQQVPTTSVASTRQFWGIGYEDTVNSGKIGCCAANGSNKSCTDTGVTYAIATEYTAAIYQSGSGTQCSVNGSAWVQNTGTNPTSIVVTGASAESYCITNLSAGTARTFYISQFDVLHN